MKVVLDTNVFISGIFWTSTASAKIIDLWKQKKFTLVSSSEIIAELVATLSTFKIQLGKELILEWEKIITSNADIVVPKTKIRLVKDDPDDNKFFEAAIEGSADYVVSQDHHLLKIGVCEKIKVVTPSEFLQIVYY